MTTVLAIDPGAHSGFAWIRNGVLVACGKFDPDTLTGPPGLTGDVRATVVIERPRDRPGKGVPANDLITLALRAGTVGGICRAYGMYVSYFFPEQWKGNLSKAVGHVRIRAALRPDELPLWPKSPDARDAVGLGLWAVGRNPCGLRGG